MNLLEKVETSISSLLVDQYEIYWFQRREVTVEAKEGTLESLQEASSHGLAVRLFRKGRVGFASTSSDDERFLERVVRLAYNSLSVAEEGVEFALPAKGSLPTVESLYDKGLEHRPFEEKAQKALELERTAKEFDRRVVRVRGARYEEREETVSLHNSRGFRGKFAKTLCEISLMVMAEEKGQQESAWESDFAPTLEGVDPVRTAHRAAERAVSLLGAKPIATGKAPALLDPAVGASLVGVLTSAFLGDQVVKRRSPLTGRLGEEIYNPHVYLVDDGIRLGGYGSSPFDGEGSPAGRKEVVVAGQLRAFLHDRVSAQRLGMMPTGNAIRPLYKEPPKPGVSNFYLVPGDQTHESLRQTMGTGFWITDLIGVHTADPVTGDFSLGATGFWVEPAHRRPVRGVAVSGNLHELLRRVVAIGSDLKFYEGIGSPSLLISEIDIGGT